MKLRAVIATAAIALAGFGLAACSNDSSSDTTSSAASSSTLAQPTVAGSTPAGSSSAAEPNAPMDNAVAQKILRDLLDPNVPGVKKTATIQGASPADAAKWDAFAKAASEAGYDPSVITVKSVTVTGDTAKADVLLASPHAPQPVPIPADFVAQNGTWELSSGSAAGLLGSMSQHGGH